MPAKTKSAEYFQSLEAREQKLAAKASSDEERELHRSLAGRYAYLAEQVAEKERIIQQRLGMKAN